jgi:transposase
MDVIYTHCAGLDVHKKTVVACSMTPGSKGEKVVEHRTFGTMTADILALSDWLTSKQITQVALESTGEFWKPIYNLLEGHFEILVVNAKHVKNVPGRKTDVKDAEWLADLLRHGLLRGSFIPPQAQRDLRDLTRQRTNLVQDRATVVNRLHKVLEWANIKLTSVATNVTGASARAMLEAILEGQLEPQVLAELAQGRMRNKLPELERALAGRVREHHRFLIANHLAQIDFLDEQVAVFDAEISKQVEQGGSPPTDQLQGQPPERRAKQTSAANDDPLLDWASAVALLDTIPGIGQRLAEQLLAEIGPDMSRFPTEAHIASWAKLSPGNNESAGKRSSGRTGHGNRWLRSSLVQAAHSAIKVKASYLHSFYHRLAGRRGAKRAIVAVAHRILTAVYYMLIRREPFRELGATYLDERNKAKVVKGATRRLEQLGYRVTLEPVAVAAP